ncbi:MAG: GGDEF domain-containing protein [Actinobacteria bacterium]|jgi:diguanylate cyclase (GGDEF)-like protein|nr:GGDEF domain-containing protein [Actinomycetota bacterium]
MFGDGSTESPGHAYSSPSSLDELLAVLTKKDLKGMERLFSPEFADPRAELAKALRSSIPAIQAYVQSRVEHLEKNLPTEVKESARFYQDINIARGANFIADWLETAAIPTSEELDAISSVGTRAANMSAPFERVLRAVLASEDAITAILEDACSILGIPVEIQRGLLIGVQAAHNRILIHMTREFDARISELTEELSVERAKFEDLARIDPLTGVANRRAFYQYLQAIIAERKRHPRGELVLFYVDLDSFKELNDLYGHQTGDGVLKVTAERLSSLARPTDQVARLGGDEFTVVMNELPPDQQVLESIATRLIASIREPIDLTSQKLSVTASIGVALASEQIDDPDTLVINADKAMYKAKHNGKNRFHLAIQQIQLQN